MRIRWRVPRLRTIAVLLGSLSLPMAAEAGDRLPPLAPMPAAPAVVRPTPMPRPAMAGTRVDSRLGPQLAMNQDAAAPPPGSTEALAPQAVALGPPEDLCPNGECPVFYRDRPKGSKNEKRRIILNNHAMEPAWYRYYRCEHYGYYPPNWRPWPEGWSQCRRPQGSGPHPYDLLPPDPKGMAKRAREDAEAEERTNERRNRPDNDLDLRTTPRVPAP